MIFYAISVWHWRIPWWIRLSHPCHFCLLYVNNIYFYMYFESASQSNMSMKFDIRGSRDEYFLVHISSILLYLARNVLISRSSLISGDPMMNTFEHTCPLFALYVYLGQVWCWGIPWWILLSPHFFYFLYLTCNVLIQCSYWMFLLCKDIRTLALHRGIFPHIFTTMLGMYHVHNRWFLISGLVSLQIGYPLSN